jgi:predicted nucleotidyltransferase
MFAFGSVLTNRFSDKSDIDLLVDFNDIDLMEYVDNYYSLRDGLSKAFGREVDLLEDKAVRNPVLRKNIDNSKLLIYG